MKRGENMVKYHPGTKFARLTLIEREAGGNRWLVECECGDRKFVMVAKLVVGKTKTCGIKGRHGRKTTLTYRGAHTRVRNMRGAATEHPCIDCGLGAAEWTYDHADPDESTCPRGMAYSGKPEHYVPRCKSCHCRFDGNQYTTPKWKEIK